MKSLITFIVCCTTVVSVFAQNSYNTVTINYNGQNRQVLIDGKAYTPTANNQYDAVNNNTGNYTVVTNDLAPGRHTLQVVRNNNRRTSKTSFDLRNNYDLAITVVGNGSMQLKETYRKRNTTTTSTGNVPMSTASYNIIVEDVRKRSQTGARINVLNLAFANTNNYFTTNQARKLIQMVNGEAFRLQLAKAAVRGITDSRNVYSLNNLFASQASRNELADYIRNYNNGQTSGTGTTTYNTAMSDANFSALLNDIRNRWQTGAKLTAVSNAFGATNNYFTTAQTIQLIQLLSTESERLQLAKASYRKIVDPANFSQVYNLLGTQASRDDLAYYVRSVGGTTGTYEPTITFKTPMSDANFKTLIEQISGQWLPGAKKSAVLEVFSNTNNYFTTYQVTALVQQDNDEPDRMDMAKASLRSITDIENITILYNIFPSQARRDELAAYVRAYNNTYGSTTTTGISTTYRTPMRDANFVLLLDETRRLWLPGAKKAAVLETFATPNNYFTTIQAIQLIQLDNDEPDRFDMAKASYKTIVDPQNFSQVYTLFSNQTYKNELAAYVRSVQ